MDKPTTGLTDAEREVLEHLRNASIYFRKLPPYHPDDCPEFYRAINAAQNLIAFRVAARINPQVWNAEIETSTTIKTAVKLGLLQEPNSGMTILHFWFNDEHGNLTEKFEIGNRLSFVNDNVFLEPFSEADKWQAEQRRLDIENEIKNRLREIYRNG